MHRRATGFLSPAGRVIGGWTLALAAFAMGVSAGDGSQVAAQQPYFHPAGQPYPTAQGPGFPAGRPAAVSSVSAGYFDPATASQSEPVASAYSTVSPGLNDPVAATSKGYWVPDSSDNCADDWWTWQLLPDGLIYHSYLAGMKEPRFAGSWVHERERGWFHDVTLGGRVGLARYGTTSAIQPEGWQIDFEGAVFPRVDGGTLDLTVMDFRYGVPLTYGKGKHRGKLAFYHLSAHLGDEFMVLNPGVPRINYLRDALVWGQSFYWTPNLRLYGEAAYAFRVDGGAEPWEFQFGIDYAKAAPTGARPVPFFAINAHLREEVDFGGNVTLQAGYMWRGLTGNLMRIGLQCFAGKSEQFEFFDQYEEKIGLAIWYDY